MITNSSQNHGTLRFSAFSWPDRFLRLLALAGVGVGTVGSGAGMGHILPAAPGAGQALIRDTEVWAGAETCPGPCTFCSWLLGQLRSLGSSSWLLSVQPSALGSIYGEKCQEKLRLLLYRLVLGLFFPPFLCWSGGVS